MSSLIRTTATNNKALPDIVYVGGPYYVKPVTSEKLLFPFTFKNGTLDINPINGFDLTSGDKPLNFGLAVPGGSARRHGGLNLVQNIGPNFKTYIYNCTWGEDASGNVTSLASIKVYKPGVVTRVQQLDDGTNIPSYINPTGDGYVVSSYPPEDFAFTTLENYGVTYAFEKPLVVSVSTVGNGTQYITFFSTWDH